MEKRRRELLPTRYVHVVFTLPGHLAPLVLQNKKVIYDLLFRTSAETLLEVARDPQHLGAEIGFFSVLHSWSQKLELHPHVHCVVPAGGLSADGTRWIKPRYDFLLPVEVLSRIFRGKFHEALKRAFHDGKLNFLGDLKLLAQTENLCGVAQTTVPKGLGGLRETPVRRPRACTPLSGPLHSSRGHLQPPPGFLC
jgi:putative transposase